MKWFQVDSNTPSDPKIRRVLREFNNAGFGALVRLWCFIAEHGGKIGYSVDTSGRPYPVEDLAQAMGINVNNARRLLNVCAETGHINKALWQTQQVVYLPALEKRADEFTKKQQRMGRGKQPTQQFLPADSGLTPDTLRSDDGLSPVTRQDNTTQDPTNKTDTAEGGADRPSRAALESWFTDRFWPAYPQGYRGGKPEALKALLKLKPTSAMLDAILRGVEQWKASRKWAEHFIEHASTFLNQRRFEQAPPTLTHRPAPASPPKPGQTGAAAPGKYGSVTRRDTKEVH